MRFTKALCLGASLTLVSPAIFALIHESNTFTINYEGLQLLKVERSHTQSMQTTVMEFDIEGEAGEVPAEWPIVSASLSHTFTDDFRAAAEGTPTHIIRTFGEWAASRDSGYESTELQATPNIPAEGLVLEILMEDGEQQIKVLEGEAPENDAFLEAQPMQLSVQGLLRTGDVQVDESWQLESKAIHRAIGELSLPIGPPTAKGFGDMAEGDIDKFLGQAEWTGEGTLTSLEAEFEDQRYALIELTIHAEGDLPRRAKASPGQFSGDAKVAIKGKLYYSLTDQRPIALLLRGEIETSSELKSDFRGRAMTRHHEQIGELNVAIRFVAMDR